MVILAGSIADRSLGTVPGREDLGELIQKRAHSKHQDAHSARHAQDPQREHIHRFDTFVTEAEPDGVAQFDQRMVRTEFHADSKAQAQLMRSGGSQGIRERPVGRRSPGRGSRITTETNDMSARSSLRLPSTIQPPRSASRLGCPNIATR